LPRTQIPKEFVVPGRETRRLQNFVATQSSTKAAYVKPTRKLLRANFYVAVVFETFYIAIMARYIKDSSNPSSKAKLTTGHGIFSCRFSKISVLDACIPSLFLIFDF